MLNPFIRSTGYSVKAGYHTHISTPYPKYFIDNENLYEKKTLGYLIDGEER